MARPLRIEFAGAVYHITARGDRQQLIACDDEERLTFQRVLAESIERYRWRCHSYVLLNDHYHLLLETPAPNLSQGMRHLNSVYTQAINRYRGESGHLFQGRFRAILVDSRVWLPDLACHLARNPLRCGIVDDVAVWPWGSYPTLAGVAPKPKWLTIDPLLQRFAADRAEGQRRFSAAVAADQGAAIWQQLRQQIYLGDDAFIEQMQRHMQPPRDRRTIPQQQWRPPVPPLATIAANHPQRNAAMVAAYASGGYSYREIADHFGVHLSTVGRIVRSALLAAADGSVTYNPRQK